MPPENPGVSTIDADGRVRIVRALIPEWLYGETPSYCVPLHWKRAISLPLGHELESWVVWNEVIGCSNWSINPKDLLEAELNDPVEFSQRSLMFKARCDAKDRLSCAGLFASLAKIAGRTVWVAPEKDTISIWSNFAFQAAHGP